MKPIQVSAVDPALRNMGLAKASILVSIDGKLTISPSAIKLIETEKMTGKTIRQNSDDLRRARCLADEFTAWVAGCTFCFAEIPTGAQSARAALSFGIAIGILACCPISLIQVQPFETKLATVGTKTASKAEMIEWAVENYPELPWYKHKSKGELRLTDKNEHMADALAVIHAGIKTDQFQSLMTMMRAAA